MREDVRKTLVWYVNEESIWEKNCTDRMRRLGAWERKRRKIKDIKKKKENGEER
jgi:hypothetical protein